MTIISAIFVALFLACVYFLPTLVAWNRKNHTAAIFALNLFLGWTLLGWVGALVMALWQNNAPARPRSTTPPEWREELHEIGGYFRPAREAIRRIARVGKHEESPAQP